jgi:hypothetical protein
LTHPQRSDASLNSRQAKARGDTTLRADCAFQSRQQAKLTRVIQLSPNKAIRHARRVGAALLVAKLVQLARDSQFLIKVYGGDVPIIFGDLPEIDGSAASRMFVQVMASVAEFERRRIGERTKEVLAALKGKGE